MNRLVENEMEKINIKAVKEIYKNAKSNKFTRRSKV